jgi:hypothetical protein
MRHATRPKTGVVLPADGALAMSAGETLEAARDGEPAARDDGVRQHAVADEGQELSHVPIIGAGRPVHPSLAEWFSGALHDAAGH